jgi:hypothetical protein
MTQSITVAVGSPDDARSMVWRMWVQGDEVYLAPSTTGLLPFLKVSLHKSGRWHSKLGKYKSLRWQRPKDNSGLTNGIMILVDPLPVEQPFRNKTVTAPKIEWLTPPLYGKLLTLIIVIATPTADLDSSRFPIGARIVGKLKKHNGEWALLIAYAMSLTEPISQKILEERSKIKIHVKEGRTVKAQLLDGSRAAMTFNPGASGEMPTIYDLSLGWENVESDWE